VVEEINKVTTARGCRRKPLEAGVEGNAGTLHLHMLETQNVAMHNTKTSTLPFENYMLFLLPTAATLP
jgi:hypothetical protein